MELQMIAEAEIETLPQIAEEDQFESPLTEKTQARRRVNVFVIGLVALVLVAISAGWYMYSRGYESTDDAQVDGHLNPIAARIDGTIKAVHVDDNQSVPAGTLLAELDPSDDKVALQQAQHPRRGRLSVFDVASPDLVDRNVIHGARHSVSVSLGIVARKQAYLWRGAVIEHRWRVAIAVPVRRRCRYK